MQTPKMDVHQLNLVMRRVTHTKYKYVLIGMPIVLCIIFMSALMSRTTILDNEFLASKNDNDMKKQSPKEAGDNYAKSGIFPDDQLKLTEFEDENSEEIKNREQISENDLRTIENYNMLETASVLAENSQEFIGKIPEYFQNDNKQKTDTYSKNESAKALSIEVVLQKNEEPETEINSLGNSTDNNEVVKLENVVSSAENPWIITNKGGIVTLDETAIKSYRDPSDQSTQKYNEKNESSTVITKTDYTKQGDEDNTVSKSMAVEYRYYEYPIETNSSDVKKSKSYAGHTNVTGTDKVDKNLKDNYVTQLRDI